MISLRAEGANYIVPGSEEGWFELPIAESLPNVDSEAHLISIVQDRITDKLASTSKVRELSFASFYFLFSGQNAYGKLIYIEEDHINLKIKYHIHLSA